MLIGLRLVVLLHLITIEIYTFTYIIKKKHVYLNKLMCVISSHHNMDVVFVVVVVNMVDSSRIFCEAHYN